jgi:hypothetical protein
MRLSKACVDCESSVGLPRGFGRVPICEPCWIRRYNPRAAERPCQACPLVATQVVHGAHLCERCARDSKRTEKERER